MHVSTVRPQTHVARNFFSLLLSGLLVIVCLLPAFALDEEAPAEPIDPEVPYVTIGDYNASIRISGKTATCTVTLTSQSVASLKVKMVLQKKSGSTWNNVQTWSGSKTGSSLTLSKTKSVTSGGTYRLKVTFTAGSETVSQTVYP